MRAAPKSRTGLASSKSQGAARLGAGEQHVGAEAHWDDRGVALLEQGVVECGDRGFGENVQRIEAIPAVRGVADADGGPQWGAEGFCQPGRCFVAGVDAGEGGRLYMMRSTGGPA